jgi:hypothetical protein
MADGAGENTEEIESFSKVSVGSVAKCINF